MAWVAIAISALVLVLLVWGLFSKRPSGRKADPLPPKAVAGAERIGRVWTNNDPLLAVDAAAAEAWAGVDGDYDRISGGTVEVGGLAAAVLMPEIDEGPVDVFTLADGDLLLVSVTAADDVDWPEFLAAVGRTPARDAARIEVPSGSLAIFHAAAPHDSLILVEGEAAGSTPFAEELLAVPLRGGSYVVRESVVEEQSYILLAWRLTRDEARSRGPDPRDRDPTSPPAPPSRARYCSACSKNAPSPPQVRQHTRRDVRKGGCAATSETGATGVGP